MKSTKKKFLLLIVMAMVSTILLTSVSATANSRIDLEGVSFSYEGISSERAERIVRAMLGIPDESTQPLSILCWFGHNLSFGTIVTVQHRQYAANPRCRESRAAIEYCTRNSCNHFVVTSEVSTRIGCC